MSAEQSAWARRGEAADGNRAAMMRQVQPLLDKGAAALSARDFTAAAKAFGHAYRSAPLPEVLLQLARLAQAQGLTTEAYDLYRRYLADPTRVPDRTAAQEAEALLATPPPGTGSVSVHGPPAALVLIDGRVTGVLPLPQPLLLSAGDHTLLLEAGSRHIDTPLKVQEGRLTEVRTGRNSGALLITVLPALLVLDDWAGLPTETVRPFSEAVERAAIQHQLGVMPAAVALRQADELRTCLDTASCQQQLAKRSGLDYVLRSRTARSGATAQVTLPASSAKVAPPTPPTPPTPPASTAPPADATARWTFALTLRHIEVSEPAAQLSVVCESCTADQATARYREALTEVLSRGLPRQLGTAEVTSEPTGAAVTMAASALGPTPLHLNFWEGTYELTLKLAGHKPAVAPLTIAAGITTPLNVRLEAEEPLAVTPGKVAGTGRRRPPRWRLALGGTLVSVGALLLTAGGFDLLIDGLCVPVQPADASAGAAQCRVLYDTRGVGIASLSVGLAFGIAGTVLLALPGPRPPAVP